MSDLWQLLEENWVATLVGVLALGIAIHQLLKSSGPSLNYQFTGQRIVGKSLDPLPSEVTISFKGNAVDHLSKSEIILWNSGPDALRRNDIPSTDPLRLDFSQATILQTEITAQVRESSKVEMLLSSDRKPIVIEFEFLDKGDGALLTLWHDGVDTTPKFNGVIIGQSRGINSLGRFRPQNLPDVPMPTPVNNVEKFVFKYRKLLDRQRLIVPWLMVVLGSFLTFGNIFHNFLDYYIPFIYDNDVENRFVLSGAVLGIIYTLTGIYILRLNRRKFPKQLIPPDFVPENLIARKNEVDPD